MTESSKESKYDAKIVINTVKSTAQQVFVFKSNRMFGTKYSKTNQLQKFHQVPNKCIEYKIFELKYGNTKLLNI